jgi:hypothetical protein
MLPSGRLLSPAGYRQSRVVGFGGIMASVVIDTNLNNSALLSDPITSDLLGTNILSGFETGDNVDGGETYDDLIDDLLGEDTSTSSSSSMTVRFPGGTLTEDFWEDPEAPLSIYTPIGKPNGSDQPMSTAECIELPICDYGSRHRKPVHRSKHLRN